MTIVQNLILAIIEGITEFLPVSSTGHMIIASSVMGINENTFVKTYEVSIQFGAILSVVVLYWRRFFQSLDFYFKLFVAFLPAAVIGLLLNDYIDMLLESVIVVAVMLVLGGVLLIFVDRWFTYDPDKDHDVELKYPTALKIGFFQCIAMIPGTSRSAATIIGAMTQKLNRKQAAEFSFFLAVPTMLAAAGYKLLKTYKESPAAITENIEALVIGNVVAFVVAMLAIKFFISFLTKYGFKVFGYYRIVVGLAILIMWAMGVKLQV
ncbi:undecaprenyl-diphosphate phosphatase [uncultured Microscilla sp.]|uniref:undecaprenyl-diphosphate phosphatase n=1 Tax=uncultured Microscilla sp. TaxID=432653 RepID=UPI00260D2775|nr:undecaprenyl-diphosphate phosphatase [uncultured Microscilla sp.]